MNKNDLMKWLLIAGAAYLVYRYLQSSGAFGATQPVAGSPNTKSIAEGETTSTSTSTATTPTVAQALIAVMKANNFDPNASYNGFQWNWFWQRTPIYNGKDIGPTEMGISDTATVPLSVAVAAVGKILSGVAGIDGLSRLQQAFGAYTPVSGWSM